MWSLSYYTWNWHESGCFGVASQMCHKLSEGKPVLGPVYTMVENSTGHEKKGLSQLWLVENGTLDRWVFTLGEEHNGGEFFSWMIKWHGRLTWPYVAALFGVRLLWPLEAGQETPPPEKPNSIRNILLLLIILQHIHHLSHITMSWPSFLTDRRPSPP